MKILSIIAQKPSSTGSGIYLNELVRYFKNMGHEQEIICAIYENDENVVSSNKDVKLLTKELKENTKYYEPRYNEVVFNTDKVPIKIAGMSDVMPYETIKYSELALDKNLLNIWEKAFREKIVEVMNRFRPDLIICHHLYLLTAMVIDYVNSKDYLGIESSEESNNELPKNARPKIYGICHNTDLRQLKQTDLKREYIKERIRMLDRVFAPSTEHKKKIIDILEVPENKIKIVGIGYNSEIFKNNRSFDRNDDTVWRQDFANDKKAVIKLLYVGKIAKKKGVLSLIKAFNKIDRDDISLDLIGGAGDKEEYDIIRKEALKSQNKIRFISPMSQIELAKEYNSHDIFILPSFSEGIPMVPIEAMACGCKLVISDLPGVKEFYDANVKNASIKYVTLPNLINVDDADDSELSAFEERLAKAINESINDNSFFSPELSCITWENIAKSMLDL